MSEFKKNNSGRPKNSKNSVTQKSRELFLKTISSEAVHISVAFEELRRESPEKYLNTFAKYIKYWLPAMTENIITTNEEVKTEFVLSDALQFLRGDIDELPKN